MNKGIMSPGWPASDMRKLTSLCITLLEVSGPGTDANQRTRSGLPSHSSSAPHGTKRSGDAGIGKKSMTFFLPNPALRSLLPPFDPTKLHVTTGPFRTTPPPHNTFLTERRSSTLRLMQKNSQRFTPGAGTPTCLESRHESKYRREDRLGRYVKICTVE